MKKWWGLILIPVLLIGCGRQELETVNDEYLQPAGTMIQQTAIQLPEGAALAAMEHETAGTIYFCDNYIITLQTMDAGDLDRTLVSATGHQESQLQLVQTQPGAYKRYDCVWSCTGEGEEQVGRAAILDDGNYHYVLTCMADCSQARDLQETWNALFSSFCLAPADSDLYTGS